MTNKKKQARRGKRHWIAAGAASGAVLVAMGVQAQDQGTLVTLGLSFGGQYSANDPAADDYSLSTRLSFDLRSSTRQGQSFGLSADGRLVLDEDGFGFDRPGLSGDYAFTNRSTALRFGASFREQDVDGETPVLDPDTLSVVDFIEDDGTRQTLGLTASLQTGLDARFGTDTRLSYNARRFTGTSDPGLTDLDTWQASTALRFEIDPRFTLRGSASYRQSEEEDAANTERRTTRVGIGADLALDRLWSATVDLSYSRIETERDIIGTTRTEGGGFALGIDRAFRTGTLGVSLARQITETGPEDSLRLRRELDLANGGSLAWSLGVVSFDNGETSPIGSIAYSAPTPRGNFSVNLQQSTAVNSDDLSTVRTILGITYGEEITATSGWSLNGSLASVDVVGSSADDQLRAEIGLGYNHALTDDWDLSTRLRHRVTYEGGDRDTSASILSFSLERSFSFRP
jgi:hypothetical protein